LESYNTLVDHTTKVLPSEVFFTPSPDPQVVAPHNFLQGEVDGVKIGGIPTSLTTSSAHICSSPTSGPAAAGVLSALSVGGVSNLGAADGTAGDATDILLGVAAAPGGDCTALAPGLPADTATGDSLLELAGSTTLEGVERGTADQSGMKDLTPDSATCGGGGARSASKQKSGGDGGCAYPSHGGVIGSKEEPRIQRYFFH
jgi:hypothetical protein